MSEKNELPELKKVKGENINTKKYVGKQSTIEIVEIKTGKFSSYVKLSSEKLGVENEKDIRASMIFSLKDTPDGLAIPEKGDLAKFMLNKKVEDYRELKDCPITILDKTDENKIDWLIFQ